jgi:hypothetical protein
VSPDGVSPLGAGVVIAACVGILAVAWGLLHIPESDIAAYPPDQHANHWRKRMTTQALGLRFAWLWYVLPLFLGVAFMVVGRGEGLRSAPAVISLAVLTAVGVLLAAANISAGRKFERYRDEWFGGGSSS